MTETIVTVDLVILAFVGATVIPMLTALITKAQASARFKALTTLALAIVGSIVESAIAHGGAIDVETTAVTFVMTYISAIGLYYGLLKPTGAAPAVQAAVPGGIGVPESSTV